MGTWWSDRELRAGLVAGAGVGVVAAVPAREVQALWAEVEALEAPREG